MRLIVGAIIIFACVFGSYAAMGGHLEVLWQPFEFVIIGFLAIIAVGLLVALGLYLLINRTRVGMLVRAGATQGEVTAVFDLPAAHPARAVLAEAGIEAEDELILRRVNAADGRKTGWVNDRRVSGEVLRALSDSLVELHGQHDDRGLLNPRGHRALLDAFAGLDLAPVREARVAAALDGVTAPDAGIIERIRARCASPTH